MKFIDKSNKTRNLIKRIDEIREKISKKYQEKKVVLKRAVTLGILLTTLMTPLTASANSPLELEDSFDLYSAEVQLSKNINSGNAKIYNDRKYIDDINWSKYFELYSDEGLINIELDKEGKPINNYDNVKEIHINDHVSGEEDNEFLPDILLSDIGQVKLQDYLKSMPSLKNIVINTALPTETVLKLNELGYNITVMPNRNTIEKRKEKTTNDFILGMKSFVENGGIAIYNVKQKERNGEYPNYEQGTLEKVVFNGDISDLNNDELIVLSKATLERYDKKGGINNECKKCLQIKDVTELSTEEAMNLVGKIDYIKISSTEKETHEFMTDAFKSQEPYTLDEYIAISKSIDEITSKIDKNASDFEKAVSLYYILGNKIAYNNEMAAKKGDNRPNFISNLLGPLVYNSSVCGGIAEAYKACADRINLNAEVIIGEEFVKDKAGGHAFNQVMINGNWVNIDLTFDLENTKGGNIQYFGSLSERDGIFSENFRQHLSVLNQDAVHRMYEYVKEKINSRDIADKKAENGIDEDIDR